MCTVFTYKNNDSYFARNMDIEYHFNEEVVITPRNYNLTFEKHDSLKTHYAIIGMATVINNYPLYADAFNEYGLAMAGLNFPNQAKYKDVTEATKSNLITPYEFIPYILGLAKTVDEAKKLLLDIDIINIKFMDNLDLAPLHWIISDGTQSIVVETNENYVKVYDNPFNVLTNNPPFPFHKENIRQYLNLTNAYPENRFSSNFKLTPFSLGSGMFGINGDYSSPSRFIKAAFLKEHLPKEDNENIMTIDLFNVLDAVKMINGAITTKEGKFDTTIYSAIMNLTKGYYQYRTYFSNTINRVSLTEERKVGKDLLVFPINNTLSIKEF